MKIPGALTDDTNEDLPIASLPIWADPAASRSCAIHVFSGNRCRVDIRAGRGRTAVVSGLAG